MVYKALLISLRTSMWVIPMLMVTGAILLAYGCIRVDDAATVDFARNYPQPFAGGADSIRIMLSAIATSMITVSGITFSLTIASLAQVSGQLTARVLRNFMSNTTNKLVLGFFVGLFLYCLIVIRTIRGKDDLAGPFVPALSVFTGMLLAVVGVGVLIYFIHFVALSIQASTVVSSVTEEALNTIDKLYPRPLADDDHEVPPALPPGEVNRPMQPVSASTNGYIQLIDEHLLTQLAMATDSTVRIEAGVGDFVTQQSPLVSLFGFGQFVDQATINTINRAFTIRQTRTIDGEIAFGIRQLVDIALKALAPSSEDTTTAVLALDYLSAVLGRLVQRQVQPPATGEFIPKYPSFANLMAGALDQIREAAGGNPALLIRLLVLLQVVGRPTSNPGRRAVLQHHTRLIAEQADTMLHTNYQRNLVRQQLDETLDVLEDDGTDFMNLLRPV